MTIQSFSDFERDTKEIVSPFRSRFGAMRWRDAITSPSTPYEWLLKNVLPANDVVIVYGATQTGKSYWTFDMAGAVSRGAMWRGLRAEHRGVVYCAFEGGKGFRNRLLAYAETNDLLDASPDLVLLTRPADLFGDDVDTKALIEEIDHLRGGFSVPLGLIVLDTYSAATPGASEIAVEDVSRVKKRIQMLASTFNCCVMVVHHKPKGGGSPRGHGSLTADMETAIDIDWKYRPGVRMPTDDDIMRDEDGRPIRQAVLKKQREGDTGARWEFVLRAVQVGVDKDGDPVTACVVQPPAGRGPEASQGPSGPATDRDGSAILKPNMEMAFRGLIEAIKRHGRPAPEGVRAPAGAMVVSLAEWRDEYERLVSTEDESADELKERVKKARDRAIEKLLPWGFIGKDGDYVWRTQRRVKGIDPPERKADPPQQHDEDFSSYVSGQEAS